MKSLLYKKRLNELGLFSLVKQRLRPTYIRDVKAREATDLFKLKTK